jgi:PAS domain S-box-containing protein
MEALRGLNQTLRALVQSCPLAIMLLEPEDGVVRLWNPAAERIFGWREDEVLGRPLPSVPDDRWDEFLRNLQAVLCGTLPQGMETLRRTKGGETIHVSLWTNTVPDEHGRPRVLTLVADVTARKQIENALRKSDEELRHRVKELAAEDRRKDEFLAMLAHELRNPLGAISNAGYVLGQLDQTPAADARTRDLVAVIGRQIRHLSRLVDDLLDVSRFTRGRIELRKREAELRPIVEGAVETTRPMLEEKGHRLTVSLPGEPVYLDADATRIEQVLANLLHNAAKFTDPGGKIELTAEITETDGGQVVLRVRDDGQGIEPELLPRIFDLFVQEDRTLARSHGGLGIGLTLVHGLVERHGGTVEAHSGGPGCGSELVVRLPCRRGPAAEPDALRQQPEADERGPARVLLVEDNLDAAEALAELLRLWGHDVEVAHDGAAAVQSASTRRPDVILLDIGLPGMDGYQVAGALRRLPELQGTLIVALTGYGQESDRQRSARAGFDCHLVKPVDLEELRRLVSTNRGEMLNRGAKTQSQASRLHEAMEPGVNKDKERDDELVRR